MITSIAEDLWGVQAPFRVAGIRLGSRMTVIRLRDGTLALHSPVAIDEATRREIEALGRVSAVIAPSKVHHLFVKPICEAFPDAQLFGAPGLAKKRRDLSFAAELDGSPPPGLSGSLDQLLVEGAPLMNEVLFFHPRSRSLIVTDMAFNIGEASHWWTRSYLKSMGAYGGFRQSRMVKLCVRDRRAFAQSIERALGWDFERVVMTHGQVLESGGKDAISSVFSWASGGR